MNTKNKPIPVIIKDKHDLHSHYMPFIEAGAIFVPTENEYLIGDKAVAQVFLKDIGKKIPVMGKVAWVTPNLPQNGIKAGVGIQFMGANAPKIKQFLEKMLGELLNAPPVKTLY